MQEHLFIEKKQKYLFLGLFLSVFLVMAILILFFIKNGNDTVDTQVQSYLGEISQQTSYKVNQRVTNNLLELTILSKNLSHVDVEDYIYFIEDTVESSAFAWIGFIDSNGNLNVQGHEEINLSELKVVQEALDGQSGVSGELVKIYDESEGALYVAPLEEKINGQVAIAGWIPPATMKLLLNTDTFSGTGFSHIISKDGNFILKSTNTNAVLKSSNFFESFNDEIIVKDDNILLQMKSDISNKKSGTLEFNLVEGGSRILTYTPLEKGDWYLLSIVSSDVYSKNILTFINLSIVILAISLLILFIIVVFIVLRVTYKKNKEISDIAYKDPVTQGYTQARFDQEFSKLLKEFKPVTFISLDIRKFKLINDSFGSEQGNKVLKYVYQCIKKNLKDGEFVSRVNADNFNIIIKTTKTKEVQERLNKISEDINKFNLKRNTPYYLPLDCGSYIVIENLQELVAIRDKANVARKNNKNMNSHYLCSNVLYNDIEHQQMMKEKEMENMMERALDEEQFLIYLQPKVSLKTGEIIGSEALVRWANPTMGMIQPNDFIPFFEKNNFIVKLDMYVFEKVCQTLRKWMNDERTILPISVNLSRNHLHNAKFLQKFKEIQEKYEIPSNLIEIELTETVVFENLELLKKVIDDIHACGYLCSMDDFGSGYSSLNVLKEIPVDILKLDKVFFNNDTNDRGKDIVESIISLARKLDMKTIAEGIETIPQVELLKSMECDMVQGYVFSKPIPVEKFEDMIHDNIKIFNIEV